MVKVHYQDSQDTLVKAAGRMVTLIEGDRHIKEAASNAMTREMLLAAKPDKDHFLQHVIAMGDHEHYGFNKNADAFRRRALEQYHDTFVTNGHFFREHRNSSPDKSIGVIKASCYNAPMGRVELAVWGRLRPVGKFTQTAEEEYEMAKQGKELSYSMSCKVPNDCCNICGHVAPSVDQYCDHMLYHAGQYMPEHRKFAFVFNDHPKFFDISKVANPADRIAHHLEFVFEKAANQRRALLGAEAAALEGALDSLAIFRGCIDPHRQALLRKLAAAEELVVEALQNKRSDAAGEFAKLASAHAFRGELTPAELEACQATDPSRLWEKLARAGVLLPFYTFTAYATARPLTEVMADPEVRKSASTLPHLFRGMLKQAACPEVETLFDPGSANDEDEVNRFMDEVTRRFSISAEPIRRRVLVEVADGDGSACCCDGDDTFKEATAMPDFWARCYGFYKLSALQRMLRNETDIDHMHPKVIACVSQNKSIASSSVDR